MNIIEEARYNLSYVADVLAYKTRKLDPATRQRVQHSLELLGQALEELKAIEQTDTKREGN